MKLRHVCGALALAAAASPTPAGPPSLTDDPIPTDTKVSVGAEITRQGSDTTDGTAETRAGVGSIIKLSDHNALLFSGGPTWADHRTGYHFYGALGLFF